jgi:hypothetical protein
VSAKENVRAFELWEVVEDEADRRDLAICRYADAMADLERASEAHDERVAEVQELEDLLADTIDSIVVASVQREESERLLLEAAARVVLLSGEARIATHRREQEIEAQVMIAGYVAQRKVERAA